MENSDLLLTLSSRLDNQTLALLSRTPLWSSISTFADTAYFWFLRICHRVGRDLAPRLEVTDWKRLYYLVDHALASENPYVTVALESSVAVSILLEAGYDPALDDN